MAHQLEKVLYFPEASKFPGQGFIPLLFHRTEYELDLFFGAHL